VDAPGFVLDLTGPGPKLSRVRACVIFNPAAKGQKAERFRRCLDVIATEATFQQTTAPHDARRLATKAVAEGFDTIIAAGGDGTLNEVLNGIGDAPDGFNQVRLGVLPLGTVNVFARELKIPLQPEAAWAALRRNQEQRVDLAFVESGEPGQQQRTYIAQLAGAGLDSRAIELVNWPLKKKIGPLAYVVAGLRAMNEKYGEILVSDGIRTLTGQLVLVGNGRLYGGKFQVFPGADMADGKLDVAVFPKVNWPTLCRCGLALLLQGKLPEAKVIRLRASSFTVIGESFTRFEVDGELAGQLPVRFGLRPAALRVLVP
jgi:YegS/Rv2252/BmrU family lipid kinase